MSDLYGPADGAESIATIHSALDAGVTLLDTGDYYGMGHNELLIREALHPRSPQRAHQREMRALRDPNGNWLGVDGRPAAIKNSLASRCADSARTTWTSTVSAGSIPRCRSRTPSEHG